jgi:general secretion pathway protein B
MSYILDALRKSDQQRQLGAAPKLHMGQMAAAEPKQPAYMYYGLLAAVLLCAGIAIGWLRPWQAAPSAPPAHVAAAKLPEANVAQPAPVRTEVAPAPVPGLQLPGAAPLVPVAPAPAPAPAAAPVPTPAPVPVRVAAPAAAKAPAPVVASAPVVTASSAPPATAPAKAQSPASAKAESSVKAQDAAPAVPARAPANEPPPAPPAHAPVQNVIWLAELPLALQQELPPMTVSVHAYSPRPSDRMVGINNRMLREGEFVAPGLKLEQITPEGMVLGYKGYSFRRGVK